MAKSEELAAPGSEDVDDLDETREVLPTAFSITSYGADYPVDGLVQRLNSGDIVVPLFSANTAQSMTGFRREFVWKKPQADRFIESLLLGLPVPGIFLVLDMAATRSAPEVALFVERKLENWTNAKAEKIVQLLGSFKSDWRQRVDAFLVDQRKDHIDSLIALRHRIAHGHSVGTSLGQVKAYYQTAIEVVEFVADLIDPTPSSKQN